MSASLGILCSDDHIMKQTVLRLRSCSLERSPLLCEYFEGLRHQAGQTRASTSCAVDRTSTRRKPATMLQATARRVNRQTAPVVSLQLLKQLDAASLRRYGSTSSSTSTSCALLQQPRGRAAFRHGSLIHAHGSSGIPLSLLQSRFQSTEARPSSGGATAVPPPPPPYTSDKAKRAAGASLQPDSSSEKATAAKVSASLDGAESAAALGAASKEKSGTVASTASTTAKDKKEVGKPKERLTTRVWKKIKHEANHYWNGTKLLGKEIKISARLQYKLLQGKSLTRREKRQVRSLTFPISLLLQCLGADYCRSP